MLNLRNKHHAYFLLITTLAICVRIWFIINIPCEPLSDFTIYQQIATNIFMKNGHTYLGRPIAFQGMGYPMLLGYFYRFIGSNNIFLGKILNVILSSLNLIVIFLILLKLCKNKFSLYLSYTAIAFIPNYIAYNNVLGSEVLLTCILSIIIYLQICNFNYYIKYISIGILIGLAALTKPFFLVYPLIIALTEWLKNKNLKKSLKLIIITYIFLCITISPWTYRNYKKFNMFIPVSYNGGYVLFINNNDNNTTGAWMPVSAVDVSDEVKSQFLELGFKYRTPLEDEKSQIFLTPKLDKIFKQEAIKWILNHPLKFSHLGITRVNNTFFNGCGDIYEWAMNSPKENNFSKLLKNDFLYWIFNKYIYILSFSGFIYILFNLKNIFVCLFKKTITMEYKKSILFFNIIFFILISFAFEGQQRYNFPVLFLFSICLTEYITKIITSLKVKTIIKYKSY
ncbi:membrane protein [Clostridium tetani]|uniref:hypothetical protein n=1 Tax=Clostridium tetani TaxID=1513 RepID=UPI0029558514|nr:hypothetical protein [Clostridium tetani]BDR65858.1 membrane protein [Clostridium tetani]